jgi:hypothetical protein
MNVTILINPITPGLLEGPFDMIIPLRKWYNGGVSGMISCGIGCRLHRLIVFCYTSYSDNILELNVNIYVGSSQFS